MPDPVLTERGEDVLSSIRRLVSGEPGEAPTAARAPDGAGRLLLTPAQRVDAPAGQEATRPTETGAPYGPPRRVDTDALDWQDSDKAPDDAQAVDDIGPRSDRGALALRDRDRDDQAPDRLDETARPDDAALRDLVAEIVREELAGDLGDRVTRNVRKLVRREIHRVLSGRKLD